MKTEIVISSRRARSGSLASDPKLRSIRRLSGLALTVMGLSLAPLALATTEKAPPAADAASPGDGPLDLSLYGRLLGQHTRAVTDVVGTRVDYAALKQSAEWRRLVRAVHAARPSTLSRNERLAYWINAYNILTIDLVAKHYPIDSIRDLGSFFSPVWDQTVAKIEGRDVSLGFIEHEILRKMSEPRIHAAIVCASTSCPPLARTPFHATSLDADLDAAMQAWLASPEKGVRIDRKRNRVGLSKIFDWFEEDFTALGGPLAVAARYASREDAGWLRTAGKNAAISFLDYDWSLNDWPQAR